MREVDLRTDAAALGAIVADATAGEDIVLTRDGRREAVVVSWKAWERLSRPPSFGRLLANSPLEDGDIAPRRSDSSRATDL